MKGIFGFVASAENPPANAQHSLRETRDRPGNRAGRLTEDKCARHLFLDKATGLPLKAEFKVTLEGGKERALGFTFSDYKEFDGRKHFTRVEAKQDGQPLLEAELSDFRWLEKLDAANFERP